MSEVKYAEGSTYLIIKGTPCKYGPRGTYSLSGFQTRKKKPDVAADEVAVKLDLKLPAALFDKPLLSAKINVDGEVPAIELDSETVDNIENLLRSTTGLDVEISVVEPD